MPFSLARSAFLIFEQTLHSLTLYYVTRVHRIPADLYDTGITTSGRPDSPSAVSTFVSRAVERRGPTTGVAALSGSGGYIAIPTEGKGACRERFEFLRRRGGGEK